MNPAFRVGVDEADIVVAEHSGIPRMKRAAGGILGDVNNDGQVDASDALYISLYSRNPSVVLPNNGDISLGDVNGDGTVNGTDAVLLIRYLADPSDPALPLGIGEPVGATTATASQTWKLYWTDWGTDKIQRSNLDGSGVEDLITTGLEFPVGLALDVSGGKLYWTDADTDKIQRSNLDGSGVEDLVTTGLGAPFGLALDVSGGKLYWTDAGTDKIQCSNLDGSGVEDLVTTGLESPDGLALGFVPVEAVSPLDEQTFNSQMVGKSFHAESFFLDFVSAGRFSENGRLPGSYSYANTGSNTGLLTLTYDGGQYGGECTLQLTFASATTGTLTYTCDSGDEGQETWRISEIGTPLAPIVGPRSGTDTELAVLVRAFFEAGETRAYDFRWRTKTPQGSWIGGCIESTNTEGRAMDWNVTGIVNLEPGTVYEVQYRYRNSSRCGEGTPGPWSEIGEGATSGGGSEVSGRACFVGQELSPGQSCTVDIPNVNVGSNRFEVRSDGFGCYGNICAGTGMDLNGFQASKIEGTSRWRIDGLPSAAGKASAKVSAAGSTSDGRWRLAPQSGKVYQNVP